MGCLGNAGEKDEIEQDETEATEKRSAVVFRPPPLFRPKVSCTSGDLWALDVRGQETFAQRPLLRFLCSLLLQ